jgi:hypothetical protein
MAVVAVGGDRLIALLRAHHQAGHDGFLTDVEMAEPTDESHAVHLAGLFLEATDQQHAAVGREFLVRRERRDVRRLNVAFRAGSSRLP